MSRFMGLAGGSLLGLLLAGASARAVNEADIQRGIQRGVNYLKSLQQKDGSWPGNYHPGMTALAGLTLLECGVPAKEPRSEERRVGKECRL